MDTVKEVLHNIGYTQLQDSHDFWRCAALYRGGDNKTSLCINKKSGQWFDFVSQTGGDLEELVTLTVGEEKDVAELLESINDRSNYEPKNVHEYPVMKNQKTWDKDLIDDLLPHYKFYEERGISARTLSFFNSGLQHSGALHSRYVFPIPDGTGKIIGWSGRDITNNWKQNGIKWKHMGAKKTWVYPAYVGYKNGSSPCINAIRERGVVIIVESIGDMLALWECGIKNVIVTFGLTLNPKILSFLVGMNCNVCIATNNDVGEVNRGKEAAHKILLKLMDYFSMDSITIYLPTKNDFGDMDRDEIENWNDSVSDKFGKEHQMDVYKDTLKYLSALRKKKRANGNPAITKRQIKHGKTIKLNMESYNNE